MNSLRRILVAGCLLAAVQTFAAGSFEGKMTLATSTDGGKPQTMVYTTKGQKLRMEIIAMADDEGDQAKTKEAPKKKKHLPGFLGGKSESSDDGEKSAKGQQGAMIMDMGKMEMLTLMPEEKMYMVMPMKKALDKAAEQAEKHPDSNLDVERTGKTEKILGYSCDQILVTDKDKKTVTEMWIATGLGAYMAPGAGGGGGGMFGGRKSAASAKWEEVLKGKGGFPLRVVTKNSANKEIYRMEATKVEPGAQPDSLFVPPADYQKFEMPGMGDFNPFK
jgi:hypothetical protein